MAKKSRQFQFLEEAREKQEMNISEFSIALGVSRQTYYSWLDGWEIGLRKLGVMAIKYVSEWRGELAVKLIYLMDERLVPCKCEMELWDNGPCPKHGAPSALRVEEHEEFKKNQITEVTA